MIDFEILKKVIEERREERLWERVLPLAETSSTIEQFLMEVSRDSGYKELNGQLETKVNKFHDFLDGLKTSKDVSVLLCHSVDLIDEMFNDWIPDDFYDFIEPDYQLRHLSPKNNFLNLLTLSEFYIKE